MNLRDDQFLDLHRQRAKELIEAAKYRAELKQLRGPTLRQKLACFAGRRLLALGKQLLAYGEMRGRGGVGNTVVGQAR